MTRKLTPAQLDEIEATAKKATRGPWEVIPATFEEGRRIKTPAYELMAVDIDAPYLDRADAEHIAMMDPATTLALVAEVRELRAKVERVRELHNADGERMTGSPRATGWEDYCTHCQRAAPCPTVRALDLFKALGEEA